MPVQLIIAVAYMCINNAFAFYSIRYDFKNVGSCQSSTIISFVLLLSVFSAMPKMQILLTACSISYSLLPNLDSFILHSDIISAYLFCCIIISWNECCWTRRYVEQIWLYECHVLNYCLSLKCFQMLFI